MSGLTRQDLQVLQYYAHKGNRERYWNYLSHKSGNDGYGALALGVVRNDNMPGATANSYAQMYVSSHPVNGKNYLSEKEWERVGVDLIKEDLKQRQENFDNNRPDLALNLPVENVYYSHKIAFEKNGIDQHAWTPAILMDASYKKTGGYTQCNGMWNEMLDNSAIGLNRMTSNLVRQHDLDVGVKYLGATAIAWTAATQSIPYTEKNKIGGASNYYTIELGRWVEKEYMPAGPDAGWSTSVVDSPSKIKELNEAYEVRQHRSDLRTQRHPQDPNESITQSKHTIAQNDNIQVLQPQALSANASVMDIINHAYAAAISDKPEENFKLAMQDISKTQFAIDVKEEAINANQTYEAQQITLQVAVDTPTIRGPVMHH